MASLNQIKRPAGLRRSAQRVGRGQSSGRGKQSGRGGKGQTARAGHKIRPAWRDIIKKLPKRRGFGKNRGRTVVSRPPNLAISIERLDKLIDPGAEVNLETLRKRGIINKKTRHVKIVGSGRLSKKLSVRGLAISKSARRAVEQAGGSVA